MLCLKDTLKANRPPLAAIFTKNCANSFSYIKNSLFNRITLVFFQFVKKKPQN